MSSSNMTNIFERGIITSSSSSTKTNRMRLRFLNDEKDEEEDNLHYNHHNNHRRRHQLNNQSHSCQQEHNAENHCLSRKKLPRLLPAPSSLLHQNKNNQWWHQCQWGILSVVIILIFSPVIRGEASTWERPLNMPRIQGLEVMCGAQHMEVHLNFDLPFHGLVASKGMYGHQDCVYVSPRSGNTKFVFNIDYEKCGTKPDNHGKFYENTIVVQYDEELIEAWDEAKRLRCEWFNDYEKTATKTSPMVISDLEIVEMNFHGDQVDCWMEIQEGRGPWAPPLNGIVPLGSTLTMVIAVKDGSGEFDMRVKACEASDGQNGHVLPLSDSEGCILRPKLIGKFSKVKLDDGRATVLTYAFLSAFKFPDMLNVHMRCTVEICRHGCPDHCAPHVPAGSSPQANEVQVGQQSLQEPLAYESQQKQQIAANDIQRATPKALPLHNDQDPSVPPPPPPSQNLEENNGGPKPHQENVPTDILDNIREHIKQQEQQHHQHQQHAPPQMQAPPPPQSYAPPPPHHVHHPVRGGGPPPPGRPFVQQQRFPNRYPPHPHGNFPRLPPPGMGPIIRNGPPPPPRQQNGPPMHVRHHNGNGRQHPQQQQQQDSHLPEHVALPRVGEVEEENSAEFSRGRDDTTGGQQQQQAQPPQQSETMAEPQAQPFKGDPSNSPNSDQPQPEITVFPKGPRKLRFRRSMAPNNGMIGIESSFKVVSEADLNFVLNSNSSTVSPATVVFKGSPILRSRDTVYGICLPRFGFFIGFFGLGLATLVSILIAVFLAYAHYVVKASSQKNLEGHPPNVNCAPYQTHEQILPMVILRKMW